LPLRYRRVASLVKAKMLGLTFGALLLLAARAAIASDPCTKIAGKTFVAPADAIACQKSFPFNETLRQNVMAVVSRCTSLR
jgi:hypothetical protein